ncbi:hypothetical protein ES703_49475 [subsurface metagenome]
MKEKLITEKTEKICIWYDSERRQVSTDCPFVRINSFERCVSCPIPRKEVTMGPRKKAGIATYIGDRGTKVEKMIISPEFPQNKKKEEKS